MDDVKELKKIIIKHEKRISDLEKLVKSKSNNISLNGEDTISDLFNSGFLDNQKKYGEIIKELKTQAKYDKKSNYKEILAKFTRENKIDRKMVNHQWIYKKISKWGII